MSLAIPGTPPGWSVDVLREQLNAHDANEAELVHFAAVCQRLDLSPWADQIVLIGRKDKQAGRKVYKHQLTVAGRRTLASRTGRPYRVDGPVWCGPREAGELVWRDVWDDDGHPYAARCLVFMPPFVDPVANGTVKWDEFAQYDGSGQHLIPTWASMPSHMLGKVAESLALRRAFPDVIDPAIADSYPVELDEPDAELVELVDEAAASNRTDAPGSPSLDEQAEAHRKIGALTAVQRSAWLVAHGIDDFGSAWPTDAVVDALLAT